MARLTCAISKDTSLGVRRMAQEPPDIIRAVCGTYTAARAARVQDNGVALVDLRRKQ